MEISRLRAELARQVLERVRSEHDLTYVFISHDVGAVWQVSSHVAVMKDGRVVEHGTHGELLAAGGALTCKSASVSTGPRITRRLKRRASARRRSGRRPRWRDIPAGRC